MGGWRELLHTNALRKVFRVKFSKAPERFKSQNPIFQSHLNEQGKISKENTAAMSAAMPGAQHPGVPSRPPALGAQPGAVTGEGSGSHTAPSLTPQALPPFSKYPPFPLSILMNRRGSWDPPSLQPRRLDPPQRANPKAISSASPGRAGGGSTFLSGYKALYWDCCCAQGARGCARLPVPLVPVIKITLLAHGFCQSSTEAGLCA